MHWYIEVLKKYAVFNGRASRQEYWYFFLFNIIISSVLLIIDKVIGTSGTSAGSGLLNSIYILALFIPAIAVSVRRLHDTGRSGWWMLIALIPIIGGIVLLIIMAQPSQAEELPMTKRAKVNEEYAVTNSKVQGRMPDRCFKCGKTILTKKQFISELSTKHGIEVDPYNIDHFKVSGVGSSIDAYTSSVANVRTSYEEVQKKRAFQCQSCGAAYCMECLIFHAPSHTNGGKACLSCRGAFTEL